VGGRYSDSNPRAEEFAQGKPQKEYKADGQRGFGVRTILRPKSYPDLAWPR
jgi:hypothetical protein